MNDPLFELMQQTISYMGECEVLAQIMDNFNPAHPMGPGFAAEFCAQRDRIRAAQAAIGALPSLTPMQPPKTAVAPTIIGVKASLIYDGKGVTLNVPDTSKIPPGTHSITLLFV